MRRTTWCVIGVTFVLGTASASGSEDTIGPNGINSAGLPLSGNGVHIGQVEGKRPGQPFFDDAAHSNSGTVPAQIFIEWDNITPPTKNANNEIISLLPTPNAHATQVAGVMISSDGVAPGVAVGANLYASAADITTVPVIAPWDKNALTSQWIATRAGGDVRAINMSFVLPADGGQLDGNNTLTQFIDWSAREHDTLYVTGGDETFVAAAVYQPIDNFNGVKVAASAPPSGESVYRQVASFNRFHQAPDGQRTLIDILAPGAGVEIADIGNPLIPEARDGTSFAAPHVTGTVALLQEYANTQPPSTQWTANAKRHEVMKAVLMNSADKLIDDGTVEVNGVAVPPGGLLGMERTVLKRDESTWLESTAYDDSFDGQGQFTPLDE